MSEPILREEFNQSLGRIHDKIDKISETGIQIETSAKSMQVSVDKICNCVYGNGKEGLIQKITKLATHINIQWWFIGVFGVSLLGMAFFVIRSVLVK